MNFAPKQPRRADRREGERDTQADRRSRSLIGLREPFRFFPTKMALEKVP